MKAALRAPNKLILIASLAMSLGCSKIVTDDVAETTEDIAVAMNCKADAGPVDPSSLEIQGASTAQAGQPIRYKLNQDLGCSSSQKVTWRTVAGTGTSQSGSQMKSSFAAPGQYIVSAKVQSADASAPTILSMKTLVVSQQVGISGPSAGLTGIPMTFELAVPAGAQLVSADWNFQDGSAVQNSLAPVSHVFLRAGTYQVSVTTTDSNQQSQTAVHQVSVVTFQDGLDCLPDLAISAPTEAVAGQPVNASVFIPTCLTNKIVAVTWTFGDNTPTQNNQTVQHTYTQPGDYVITVQLYTGNPQQPFVTLTQQIHVVEAPAPTPTPSPTATPVATPSPTPSPTPDSDPNACSIKDQTRESLGDLYSENMACGRDGTKVMSYRDRVIEACRLQGEFLRWTEVSRSKELQNEGPCQGQSCVLPDGTKLADGGKKVLYSSQAPEGSCSSVSQERVCRNGTLDGSSSYQFLTCQNGCEGFGPHGTTKTGVVIGEVVVPKTCEFGETGITSIFNQVADQSCQAGQVVTSNTRTGDVKTPGVCPSYSWVATEQWTSCSADCGGQQSRVYECRDDKGNKAPDERCAQAKPVENRVCDGNPDAVKREDRTTKEEEGVASNKCPKNQIGVIVSTRNAVTIKSYACVDHSVQLTGTRTEYTPWVTESYCRDFVPHRCSQDSLTTTEANNRYKWMVKCASQVPVIGEFLEMFDDVSYKAGKVKYTLDAKTGGRELYATFMNRATNPEKPWIAPKKADASCNVPSTVYVAAVCLSSCATPEQQILAEARANSKLKYMSFIDALTQDAQKVGTLTTSNDMNSKLVQRTEVDQWVTEMMDTDHEILTFRMRSGGQLKLTPNHPIVTTEGTLKRADEFKVGESLVQLGGNRDEIVSIESSIYFGKVYNVFVKSSEIHKNIVVTNGYLNGTAYFQNEGASNMNRQILRNRLTRGIFGK